MYWQKNEEKILVWNVWPQEPVMLRDQGNDS